MSKTKVLLWASGLALIAMPFLYIGGNNGSTALMVIGFALFGVGMALAPYQFLKTRSNEK